LLAFNDTGWSNGLAQLGYGDGDERTVVSYGANAGAKYITSYFRRAFNITDYAAFSALNFRILRDDGVVVYLNGTEVYRNNLPGGPVDYLSLAPVSIGGADESAWNPGTIAPGGLINGQNVIAVEVHQNSGGSSDISFDFELTGTQSYLAPFITTQPQSKTVGAGSAVSLSVVAGGSAPLSYQWRFNSSPIAGATNATLGFPSIQPTQAGGYTCVITNIAGAITSVVATVSISSDDADNDGMPDAWELANDLNPTVNDAALDGDGDGMNNLAEFIAGTDPQHGGSYLKVDSIQVGGASERIIRFNAVSNHTYSVLFRDQLAGVGPWSRLGDVPASPTNRLQSVTDLSAGPQRFYRLVTPAVP
jgi:hypothetical protein